MGKRKKDKEEYLDLEEEEEETTNDEVDMLDDDNNVEFENENPVNPMGLANLISKESDVIKNFKEMPKEVRFSFLDHNDKADIKHFARAYRNWKYIDKIITLRDMEDKKINTKQLKIYDVNSKEQIIKYLNQEKKDYLIPIVKNMEDEELKSFLTYLKTLHPDYYMTTFKNVKDDIDELYNNYNITHEVSSDVDDMDNLGKVVDTSISSMGYKGNAASHAVMTIQAVKNEDVTKVAEEKTKFSFLDSIKRRFG